MHNGLMKTGNEKMAKSKGNEIVVSALLERHSPETLRFFLLATHYRRPIDYSEERLVETQRGLDNFYRFFERYQRITGDSFYKLEAPANRANFDSAGSNTEFLVDVARHRGQFLDHMDDDFNTGGAIGVLFDLLTTLNRFADARQLEAGKPDAVAVADFRRGVVVLRELSQILGLFHETPATAKSDDDELVSGLMQLLLDLRADARKTKNFAVADQIRKRLTELNVTLEDRPGGTGWRRG
jgi:cysteinyl-tRNA synthetase